MHQGYSGMKCRIKALLFHFTVLVMSIGVLISSCKKEEPDVLLQVETLEVKDVGTNEFTAYGVILGIGSSPVIQHGFCWSTSETPSLETDTSNRLGSLHDPREFSTTIGGLSQNTSYYVRAYAMNNAGVAYGKEIAIVTEKLQTVRSR